MTGLKIKKFIFVLVGLLLTAAVTAYAAEKEKKIVKPQSAKEFLSENTTETGWKEYIDAKRLVTCGTRKCNLDRRICMTKTDDKGVQIWETFRDAGGAWKSFFGIGGLIHTGVTAYKNGATRVQVTKYECVPKSEQASFEKQGYKVSETGGKNTKTDTNKKGSKTKTEDVDSEVCYNASAKNGSKVSKYCLVMSGDTVTVVGLKEGTFKNNKCEVIPVKLYYQERCTFCFLMGGIFATADKITIQSYSKLGRSFAVVIALGLALWIAMKTLSFVSSMTKQDAAKYITEMIKQSYKFAIAYFALYYYGDVFNYIINPLLSAGLDFGNSFAIGVSMPRPELFGDDAVVDVKRSMNDLIALGDKMPSDYLLNSNNVYFRFPLYVQLEHFVYNVNLTLSVLQVVGDSLLCRGANFLLDWPNWGLSIPSLIYGFVFWFFGFLLSFAFVFYVLDAIVQLGIVGALLPLLIASWPFKISSQKWTSTGFKMLLNSIFTFMMMGIVSRVIIELIDQAVKANSDTGDAGLSVLIEALDSVDVERLKSLINVLSVGFCLFIFTNLIGYLLMGRVTELVNNFAQGGMKTVAPGAATIGTSAVKGVAGKLTAPMRKDAAKAFNKTAKNLGKKGAAFFFGNRERPSGDGEKGAPGGGDGSNKTRVERGGGKNGERPKIQKGGK